MRHYIVSIRPTSAFGTPLDSDTLFGHICWAIWYMNEDKGKLARFLERFDDQPPLILSSAFPEGYLPLPQLPPFTVREKTTLEEKFRHREMGGNLEFIQWLKRMSRQTLMSTDAFFRFQTGLSKFTLFEAVLDNELSEYNFSPAGSPGDSMADTRAAEIWHNTINRKSGVVIEGKLFSKNTTFYPAGIALNVYLKTDHFSTDQLQEIFTFIALNGYGADKSTGCGRFDFTIKEEDIFRHPAEFNAYLLLSNTNAAILKSHDGFYRTWTKFGKLGGIFSSTSLYSPFKKPVILLTPGSVIFGSDRIEFLGSNFAGVHARPDIQHYGIGYPLYMRLHDEQPE